jgi:hypothetical protein
MSDRNVYQIATQTTDDSANHIGSFFLRAFSYLNLNGREALKPVFEIFHM